LPKATLQEDVFNAALTYAAGKGWRDQLLLVFENPGPGMDVPVPVIGNLGTPTFWEAYWNISGWVTDRNCHFRFFGVLKGN